jgi:hypothetical protein
MSTHEDEIRRQSGTYRVLSEFNWAGRVVTCEELDSYNHAEYSSINLKVGEVVVIKYLGRIAGHCAFYVENVNTGAYSVGTAWYDHHFTSLEQHGHIRRTFTGAEHGEEEIL